MRVRVCVPFYSEFEAAKPGLAELSKNTEHDFIIEPRQGTYISRARNHLVNDGRSQTILQQPAPFVDAFLFVDSDINFTAADVLNLIKRNLPIVGGVYSPHDDAEHVHAGRWGPLPGFIGGRLSKAHTGLKTVDYIGAGFLLIRREVFEALPFPWFRHEIVTVGDSQDEIGEDVGFCKLAQENGFKIYADFTVQPGHKPRTNKSFNWEIPQMADQRQPQPRIPENLGAQIAAANETLVEANLIYKNLHEQTLGVLSASDKKDAEILKLTRELDATKDELEKYRKLANAKAKPKPQKKKK